MSTLYLELAAILFGIAILFLLSLVEGALIEASPMTLRMFSERKMEKEPPLLALVLENETSLFVPLHLGIQVALIVSAVLITWVCLRAWPHWGAAGAFGMVLGVSTLFRQLLPRLLTQNEAERKLILLLRLLHPLISCLRVLAAPLSGMLRLFKRLYQMHETPSSPAAEEATEEEIQAYLEIGEDEGILEKEDTRLIQSVVEFGDTLVREVMTPRPKIAACPETATLGELRNVMVVSRHSRIPIFRGDIDHIIGVAHIRQLLSRLSQDSESAPITGLIHPAVFVPETKRVSELLKELQLRGDHTAVVIDEFGGVAGLVTIEDLVEEIVGEIHDEDQAKVSEIVEEGPLVYTVRGSTNLDRLEELTGKKLVNRDASTVAGLVAAYLGRIPAPGEEFEFEGMRVQILNADRKRIHRLRIQLAHPAQP
jgi:CBS domain containing-hemolysin-like protein